MSMEAENEENVWEEYWEAYDHADDIEREENYDRADRYEEEEDEHEEIIHQYHERHKEVLKEMSMPVGRSVMDALRERGEPMSDPIDRNTAITHVYVALFPNVSAAEKAEKALRELPTVDAVEVVRCKDCKHWERKDGVMGDCNNDRAMIHSDGWAFKTEEGFFCGDGERRQE